MTMKLLDRASFCFDCLAEENIPESNLLLTDKGEILSICGLDKIDSEEAKALMYDLYNDLSSEERNYRFYEGISREEAVKKGLLASSVESPDKAFDIVILNEMGQAVGHGGIVLEDSTPQIHCIVRYGYQGNGLGLRLVEEIESLALAIGLEKVGAITDLENIAMDKILTTRGYIKQYHADHCVWEKPLSTAARSFEICCLNGLSKQPGC